MRRLLDSDGENLAVQHFLLQYGAPSLTVCAMKNHMLFCGYPFWPDWVEGVSNKEHLTKAGAQLWLRHLFALEGRSAADKSFRINGLLAHNTDYVKRP